MKLLPVLLIMFLLMGCAGNDVELKQAEIDMLKSENRILRARLEESIEIIENSHKLSRYWMIKSGIDSMFIDSVLESECGK